MNPTTHPTSTLHRFGLLFLILLLGASFLWIPAGSAQRAPASIRLLRSIETEQTELLHPAGLAFSSRANAFQVMEARPA
ncbi:MAG: hypothetical protein ACM3QS_14535, partial [Bacteroidota bacterium]